MSSTLDNSFVLAAISAIESQLAVLKAHLAGGSLPSVGKAGRVAKAKKERKVSDAPPTAWRIFTDRVRGLLKANGYTAKALGVECVQFAATLKDENNDLSSLVDADILARRAAWSAPEVSRWEAKHGAKGKTSSAANSVVSGASKADEAPATGGSGPVSDSGSVKLKKERKNPWAGLSAEDKAAKVAKMASAKAAKKAAVAVTDMSAPVADTPVVSTAVSVPLPPSPKLSASTGANAGFQRMSLLGDPYWVNKATGHCYKRNKDGSQGNWAGIFHSSGGPVNGGPYIDDSADEPGSDTDELVF